MKFIASKEHQTQIMGMECFINLLITADMKLYYTWWCKRFRSNI